PQLPAVVLSASEGPRGTELLPPRRPARLRRASRDRAPAARGPSTSLRTTVKSGPRLPTAASSQLAHLYQRHLTQLLGRRRDPLHLNPVRVEAHRHLEEEAGRDHHARRRRRREGHHPARPRHTPAARLLHPV